MATGSYKSRSAHPLLDSEREPQFAFFISAERDELALLLVSPGGAKDGRLPHTGEQW